VGVVAISCDRRALPRLSRGPLANRRDRGGFHWPRLRLVRPRRPSTKTAS